MIAAYCTLGPAVALIKALADTVKEISNGNAFWVVVVVFTAMLVALGGVAWRLALRGHTRLALLACSPMIIGHLYLLVGFVPWPD